MCTFPHKTKYCSFWTKYNIKRNNNVTPSGWLSIVQCESNTKHNRAPIIIYLISAAYDRVMETLASGILQQCQCSQRKYETKEMAKRPNDKCCHRHNTPEEEKTCKIRCEFSTTVWLSQLMYTPWHNAAKLCKQEFAIASKIKRTHSSECIKHTRLLEEQKRVRLTMYRMRALPFSINSIIIIIIIIFRPNVDSVLHSNYLWTI